MEKEKRTRQVERDFRESREREREAKCAMTAVMGSSFLNKVEFVFSSGGGNKVTNLRTRAESQWLERLAFSRTYNTPFLLSRMQRIYESPVLKLYFDFTSGCVTLQFDVIV